MHPAVGLLRGPAAYVSKSPWRPWRAVLATAGIILVAILAAAVMIGSTSPGGLTARAHLDQETAVLATLALWQAITIGLTVVASRLYGGHIRDVLALRAPAGTPIVYIKSLLTLLALQALVSAVQYFAGGEDRFADLRPMVRLVGSAQLLLALLVVGVGAPLSEELLFRGFLFSALAGSRLGFGGAAIVTSASWAALHYGYTPIGLTEVFLVGVLFAWLLWRTGSLWVAIFCHAIYNSFIVLVLRHVPLPT